LMTGVHQLVPSVVPFDATSGHTLQVQQALREAGFESEIYALAVHPDFEDRVRLIGDLRGPQRADSHLLIQFSSVSALGDIALGRRERLAVNYHNVTPPEFFRRWSPGIVRHLQASLVQLAQLSRRAGFGIGDSAFNVGELHRAGIAGCATVPVLMDMAERKVEPDPAVAAALVRRRSDLGAMWLFVGSIAPHKAQHRLVQALALYRRAYDPAARLILVGRAMSASYADALQRYIGALGLVDAVEMTGAVDQRQLAAYFAGADVFVSASAHEGFGVPLVEAMAYDVPVVARPAGAVAATVGDGGIVVPDGTPPALAAAVARVLHDDNLRRHVVAAGHKRVAHYDLVHTQAAMVEAVRRWVESDVAMTGGAVP